MATVLNFKSLIDLPMWRPNSPPLGATGAGVSAAWDNRNDATNHPYCYMLRSATALDVYDPTTDEWMPVGSPALTGTFGAGATAKFAPSAGPRGTLAAGATTSRVTLTTALPAAVGINQLANRGDGVGHRIRIIGNAAGSSGKIEERTIVGNTAGTTPQLVLDAPLTFTPALGDGYEILSGRVYMLSAGTLAAGMWKWYDLATNSFSGNLATANLPATIGGDSEIICLSELYVPHDRAIGSGFINGTGAGNSYNGGVNCIVATAAGATSITGSGCPTDLVADEYRNFQVRVVEDTTTPTAVGQRRRISTHTGGATPVFTVAAWAVTPSATAKFVIENDDDKILLFINQTAVYTYNQAGNAWDTTTFAAAAVAGGAGVTACQSYGIARDTANNARHSHIYRIRGGASNAIDVLDIAGGATGVWAADIAYMNKSQTFTTGTCGAYDPVTQNGRFLHLCVNGTQRHARFDVRNRVMDPESYLRFPQGTAVVGSKMFMSYFFDGATKLSFAYELTQTTPYLFSIAIQK